MLELMTDCLVVIFIILTVNISAEGVSDTLTMPKSIISIGISVLCGCAVPKKNVGQASGGHDSLMYLFLMILICSSFK